MKRRFKALVLAALAAALATAAACSNSDGNDGNAASPTAQPTASAASPDASGSAGAGPEDPLGKYEEGITLTVAAAEKDPNEQFPEGMDHENNPWRDAYKNELGITFENKWTVPASKFAEKLNTQIAAGDVPDIINGLGRGQFDQLVKLGLAAPLDELIDKYATDLTKQVLSSDGGYSLIYSRGEDGKLYALPHVYGFNDNVAEMWIRTDWLQKVGLKAPTTTEELYAVLKAFVENDPDGDNKPDTVGLITTNGLWEVGSIFNAFGSQPFWSWYKDDGGKLIYSTVYKPETTKAALEYMARLYKDGLMDQEFGAANYDKFNEMIISGKAGIAFMPTWFPSTTLKDNVANDPNADWEAYPIPTGLADGSPARPFAYYGPAAYNVVSSRSKHPEAAIKMLNLYVDKVFGPNSSQDFEKYILNKDGYNMKVFSFIGTDWANNYSLYENVAKAVETGDAANLNPIEKTHYDNAMAYKNGDRSQFAAYKTYGPNNATLSVVKHYIDNAPPLFANYYGPATEAVKQYMDDLDAKWATVATEIIMGAKPVAAYDTFVEDWYKLGGRQMEEETNAWAQAHPDSVK